MSNIKKLTDGRYHVKHNGEWSGYGATTVVKAEVYLSKLQRGLVHFESIRVQEHNPAFKPGFCNGASRANRLHQTL